MRHTAQKNRVKLAGNFQEIVLRPWAAAQDLEIKPHHTTRAAFGFNMSGFNQQQAILVRGFGQAVKSLVHQGLVGVVAGTQIELGLLQHTTSVVGAIVNIDDLHTGVEQINGGQHAVSVQTIGVELVGFEVRRSDKANAVDLHGHQQTVQDHRVGDICDMEFIETNQLETLGHASAQLV